MQENSITNSSNLNPNSSANSSTNFNANSSQNLSENSQPCKPHAAEFKATFKDDFKSAIKSKFKSHFSTYKFFYLALILCYAFSVVCRLYWVWWASDFEGFKFNDELMIISNDGYVFAEGARDKIAGFHQPNDLSFIDSPLSILTYFVYKFTPFSFETIILYMSVFLSSLIILPILLIAKIYQNLSAGIIAALLASIANSYYNRTMAGYYDTDMLAIVLPMLLLYALLRLIIKKDAPSLIAAPLIMAFYLWYYPSAFVLCCAFIGLFFIYTLIFHRRESLFYLALTLLIITLANVPWFVEFAIFALLIALWGFKGELFSLKFLAFLIAAALVFVAFSGGFNAIWGQIAFYIFKDDSGGVQGFAYFNVSQTIQEASNIGLSLFMQRISASEMAFAFSLFGLILLLKAHRSFILALPMLFLGFLALRGGLRFTIYAVPVMALGFGWALFWLLDRLKNLEFGAKNLRICEFTLIFALFFSLWGLFRLKISLLAQIAFLALFALPLCECLRFKQRQIVRTLALFAALFISLGYAFAHIYAYKASPVFNQSEAALLSRLKSLAAREDYVVAWWDYGYPVRYYSDVKTLADGGKHLGKDNFFPSFVLSQNERAAANLARLAVEYTEKSFADKNDTLLQNDLLKAMLRDYGYKAGSADATLFLNALNSTNFTLKTPATRDIFIYMPIRMSMIFSTVASFSKIDLAIGEVNAPFVFSTAVALGTLNDGSYALSNAMVLSNDFTHILVGERALPIHSLIEFSSIKERDFKRNLVDEDGLFYVFHLKEGFHNLPIQFIIMDKSMFESAFVQMFFFENYDKSLYELVLSEKDAKIYRLKR